MEVKTVIKGIFNGYYSYIYIWYSKVGRCAYVGQTNEMHGVLGRAQGHIKNKGTLRTRVYEKIGAAIEEFEDWVLLSYRLPAKKKYISYESSYRLAVEYLVQTKLLAVRGDLQPPIQLLSRVTYTDYCSDNAVKKLASEIVADFIASYRVKR